MHEKMARIEQEVEEMYQRVDERWFHIFNLYLEQTHEMERPPLARGAYPIESGEIKPSSCEEPLP